jgi:hypothetical protein
MPCIGQSKSIASDLSNYSDGLPVTIRFANKVGDVLTMGSAKDAEKQPLKFFV